MKIKHIVSIFTFLILTSCGKSNLKEEDEVRKLYEKGIEATYKSNYNTAKSALDKIDSDFPYTEYAHDAIVLLAYVNYKKGDYQDAIPIIDFHIKTNPKDAIAPYLLYLKAMSFYNQIKSYQKDTQILSDFQDVALELDQTFPESEYAKDLSIKYKFAYDTMLLSKLNIAIQYQKQGNCPAAIERYLDLLNWEDPIYSAAIRKNLHICFSELGLKERSHLIDPGIDRSLKSQVGDPGERYNPDIERHNNPERHNNQYHLIDPGIDRSLKKQFEDPGDRFKTDMERYNNR